MTQRRKSIETSAVASEKLARLSHSSERAWWRLTLSTDAYGILDITDIRRIRLSILGEIAGFGTNDALEEAITDLVNAGLLAEWSQEWQEKRRRFVHIVGHDAKQTDGFIRDRNRAKSRPAPVPPFDCCDHESEMDRWARDVVVYGVRCIAPHCHALPRTAPQAADPAPQADAPHCAASPSRAKVRREEKGAEDPVTGELLVDVARMFDDLDHAQRYLYADHRAGGTARPLTGDSSLLDDGRRGLPDGSPPRPSPSGAPSAHLTHPLANPAA